MFNTIKARLDETLMFRRADSAASAAMRKRDISEARLIFRMSPYTKLLKKR